MKQKFDSVIGYAGFDDVNNEKLTEKVNIVKEILNNKSKTYSTGKMLVAGCGDGTEAKIMKSTFKHQIYGVDISLKEDDLSDENCMLFRQDLGKLSFSENYFDFIYSYHVLEHVPDPLKVLQELHRVLKPGCSLFIGFPNKNRIVGYIGAHNNVTWKEKLVWNLKDYRDRLKGKFENKHGAHAGFTQKEFLLSAGNIYNEIIPVRNEYMELKYFRKKNIIDIIIKSGLNEILFPSNYFICVK